MIPVILSGGSGTRLWPLSRQLHPKQFLALTSEKTLFQETMERLQQSGFTCGSIVISNQENRFIVAENLRDINCTNSQIILEPVARNTAPAIAAAAFFAMQKDKDALLLVLPSDHIISDVALFSGAVKEAEELAKEGFLVTFGIVPSNPNTEYGYIEAGDSINDASFRIANFKEKPSRDLAEKFISSGSYFWNSGMFVFKASRYIEELEKNRPGLARYAGMSVQNSRKDLDFIRLDKDAFARCENISIDYAVMESTLDAAVVKLDANWCDVGSWQSIWDISEKDGNNNVCKGDVIIDECEGNYFHAEDKLIAATGVQNLIVVDTKDALLIADKASGNIRKIVSRLKSEGRSEAQQHRVVYRPWGHFDTICKGERDLVKRITIKPGAKLSSQMHCHRSEHWVVVKGTAKVLRNNEIIMLAENESIYLPAGCTHSLENAGETPLEIIEIQTGNYLSENDIVRFEDLYGRVEAEA